MSSNNARTSPINELIFNRLHLQTSSSDILELVRNHLMNCRRHVHRPNAPEDIHLFKGAFVRLHDWTALECILNASHFLRGEISVKESRRCIESLQLIVGNIPNSTNEAELAYIFNEATGNCVRNTPIKILRNGKATIGFTHPDALAWVFEGANQGTLRASNGVALSVQHFSSSIRPQTNRGRAFCLPHEFKLSLDEFRLLETEQGKRELQKLLERFDIDSADAKLNALCLKVNTPAGMLLELDFTVALRALFQSMEVSLSGDQVAAVEEREFQVFMVELEQRFRTRLAWHVISREGERRLQVLVLLNASLNASAITAKIVEKLTLE